MLIELMSDIASSQVLKWEDVEIGEPKEGEVRVRNKAVGVNFIDVYFRKGVYKAPSFPFTPGSFPIFISINKDSLFIFFCDVGLVHRCLCVCVCVTLYIALWVSVLSFSRYFTVLLCFFFYVFTAKRMC